MTTQAVRDKGAEQSRHELLTRRIVSYLVLAILCFLCLFFFYVLLINATRNHYQIQRGFSFLPGKSFTTNLKNVLADANIPILSGIKNSLLVAALSAALSIYFSALTAYGVHAYDFKLKKIASAFIILIMTMPTQVSALGFLRLMTNMKLTDTLIPLFLQRARACGRQNQRHGDAPDDVPLLCAGDSGGFLQRRVHALQRGDHLHEHEREVIRTFHKDDAADGVDVKRRFGQPERGHQPFVQVAGARREQQLPRHRAEERREHVRNGEHGAH